MNKFRYYYEIAEQLLNKSSESITNIILEAPNPQNPNDPQATAAPIPDPNAPPIPDPNAPPPIPDPNAPLPIPDPNAPPPIPDPNAPIAPAAGGEKITGDVKDKVKDDDIIKKVDGESLVFLETQIDNLSIKILEKKEKIMTVIEAISFLNNIDDTKPNRYKDENKYKIINEFLTSTEYDNLGISNLFAIHNSLKENFKIVQKAYKDRKENKKMEELKNIAEKAKRAKFSKNINKLKAKIEEIKSTLNNINQIFNLKDFPKMEIKLKKQIKLAQKNSIDFIKKLS